MTADRSTRAASVPLPITCREWGGDLSFARDHDEARRDAADSYFERRRERLRRRRREQRATQAPADAAATDSPPDER